MIRFLYRTLGMAAWVNNRLAAVRVNLFPLDLLWLGLLFTVYGFCVMEAGNALLHRERPAAMSVAALLAGENGGEYVRVLGELHPESAFELEVSSATGTRRVERVWAPMLDLQGTRALFVELKGSAAYGARPRAVAITGTLRPMAQPLSAHVEEMGGRLEGIPVETETVLVEGESSASPAIWMAAALLALLTAAPFAAATALRNIIFVPARSVNREPSGTPALSFFATGRFRLDARTSAWLTNVESVIELAEDGSRKIVADADLVYTAMGIRQIRRSGRWTLDAHLDGPLPGILHLGCLELPALLLAPSTRILRFVRTAALTFDSEEQRDSLHSHLTGELRELELAR